VELRDGDRERYGGAGVLRAVANVNGEIGAAVLGKDWDQATLDNFLCQLDGATNKARLGANAILAVSLAFARAASVEGGQELYEYLGGWNGDAKLHYSKHFTQSVHNGQIVFVFTQVKTGSVQNLYLCGSLILTNSFSTPSPRITRHIIVCSVPSLPISCMPLW
jgi:hypothetical protein